MMDIIRRNIKKTLTVFISILFFISITGVSYAATTITPCPSGATSTQKEQCVTDELGFTGKSLADYFPKFGSDDLIGTAATILLSILVLYLLFRILRSAFKLTKKDDQGKEKKEAIKVIRDCFIGLLVSFSAFGIILFLRPLLVGNSPLINCANTYYKDYNSYFTNSTRNNIADTTSDFQRCIDVIGKTAKLSNTATFNTFISDIENKCSKGNVTALIRISGGGDFSVADRQKLNQCFADILQKV